MTEKLSETKGLKKLGSATEYVYDGADKELLERFPNPLKKGPGVGSVEIVAPEFTSLCPLTGQPDFATIVVEYVPRTWCVESKAWKMYLGSFRNFGEFHESCVRRIANDLIELLDPHFLKIEGQFTPRGGIPFWPTVEYTRPEIAFEFKETPGVLEDKNVFFLGESTFEKCEHSKTSDCLLARQGVLLGTAEVAEIEVGLFDEMARKYAAGNYAVADRARLKEFLEETTEYAIDDETVVTVVWFKNVTIFEEAQELGDASSIVPLHKD